MARNVHDDDPDEDHGQVGLRALAAARGRALGPGGAAAGGAVVAAAAGGHGDRGGGLGGGAATLLALRHGAPDAYEWYIYW